MSDKLSKVAVVIPSYGEPMVDVVAEKCARLDCIDLVIVVNDNPVQVGEHTEREFSSEKICVVTNTRNLGVGGAYKRGLRLAKEKEIRFVCKIDADDQMDVSHLPSMVNATRRQNFHLVKLNRLKTFADWRAMPVTRLIANFLLTLVMKLVTGYWNINDPANGQFVLDLNYVDESFYIQTKDDFAFEASILFYFSLRDGTIAEFSAPAIYYDYNNSYVNLWKYYPRFFGLCLSWFFKRVSFQYLLKEVGLASLSFIVGISSLLFGLAWGTFHWFRGALSVEHATVGTVGIVFFSLLVGIIASTLFLAEDSKRNPGNNLGKIC